MEHAVLAALIERKFDLIATLTREYGTVEADRNVAGGNAALCIIDEGGYVYGRMFGDNKVREREIFRIAWTKASQVWITGMKTGKFEELVYAGKVDDGPFGIRRPDFIGWEGGQPITLKDGTVLSIGFSGFRSATDLEIVVRAFQGE